jgi:quercetin dioxygenase-like cupin family protein
MVPLCAPPRHSGIGDDPLAVSSRGPEPKPTIRRPGDDAPLVNPVGGEIRFKLRGEHSGGRLMVLETIIPPGEGPPLHTHAGEDEVLLVLEGAMRFRLGDAVEAGPTGSFVYVPRGTAHTWQNIGQEPARMLVLFTPAGMERFFDAFAALATPGAEAFARAGAEAAMKVVGPPLAVSHPLPT